ncbi:hypothetical protein [Streptomyces sp. PSKA30]|uniref:hypothetical protein n=1 Tax=Streptomyces sp. PSKA30 TaxID=2874597 RepID=UPI001CD04C41|nr:hypothetical protein [Streptomyces sp. PSKA30]MBZ9645028.1 hypothetical protein [Streptomyces sp. PSKA30]
MITPSAPLAAAGPGTLRRYRWPLMTAALAGLGVFGAVLVVPAIVRRRLSRRLAAVLLILAAAQGTGALVTVVMGMRAPICRPPTFSPPGQAAAYTTRQDTLWVSTRQALTAGPTGLALIYAQVRGADVCRFAPNGNLIARMDTGYARAGTMIGHLFLTYPKPDLTYEDLVPLTQHEARHADQWAVAGVLGGPMAFPAAYTADELLAPGAHNHFERHAGLTGGGYTVPDQPPRTLGRLAITLLALTFLRQAFRRLRRRTHRGK